MFYKPINVLYMKKLILTLLGILFLSAFSAFAQEFTLLTDGSKLANGMQFYIANVANKKAMSTTQNKNNRGAVSVTIADNVLTPVDNAQFVTLEDAGSGNWYLKVGDNQYLYPVAGQNYLKTGSAKTSEYVANITIASDGTATIKFSASATETRYLKYNNSSSLFSCYKSGQLDVAIFVAQGPSLPTITLAFAETEGTVNVGETLNLPAITASASDDTTPELTYTYTSDKPEIATVSEAGVVTGVAAGSATITASSTAEGYNVRDAKYTVNVIDPNALEQEIVFAEFNYSNQQEISTVEKGIVTLTFDKGSNSIAPKYFTNNKDVRLYAGGSLTITVPEGYFITKIESVYNNTQNALTPDSGEFNTDFTVWNKTTDVNTVKFTEGGTSGNRSWTKIVVYYALAGDPGKSTPKLSFAEATVTEEFAEGKTVAVQAVTSDTEGLSYTYKSSDPAVATVEGETITLVGPGTTTITVTSADTETLNSATASYTLNVEMVYNSLADLFKYAKDGDLVDINFPMTIGYAGTQKQNFYVTDGTAYVLIYDKGGNHNLTYEDGDIIPGGWSAECEIYGGLPELLVNSAMPAATEKGTYEIETINAADWTAQPLNKIVIVDNVEFTAATPSAKSNFTGTSGETEINFYNNFALPAEEAGTYKVTAIVSHYTRNMTTIATEANQLAPLSFSAQPTEAVITPTPENDEIKVKAGDVITFTFANASKLEVVIETEEAPESESGPVLKAAAEPITVEGDTYKYTVPDQVLNTIITVTPYNAEGEKLADRAASVMLVNADTTGVIDVTVSGEGEVEYFNLQGVRVANPESGLYIRRQGNQVSKVYLR